MASITLRPDATLQAGTSVVKVPAGDARAAHQLLSDASDSTGIINPYNHQTNPWVFSDAAPAAALTVVSFTNLTGAIPAGRKILKVWGYARYHFYDVSSASGGRSAAVSIKYSDNKEWWRVYFGGGAYGNKFITRIGSSTTAYTANGATKGAWTYALVDGMKAVIGFHSPTSETADQPVYDIWLVVDYTDAPPVPSDVKPASLSSQTTGTPTLAATVKAIATKQRSRIEWQVAQDTAFTQGLRTMTEPTSKWRTSGATTMAWPANVTQMSQGTWYIRARQIDEYGVAGSYSTVQTFTVAHPPSSRDHQPTGDTYRFYGNVDFTWSFSDPSPKDSQTAYQIVVEVNDDGTLVFDTGKVLSSATTGAIVFTDDTVKDAQLRWRLQVWDSDDKTAGWSDYQIFRVGDAPTVIITEPLDADAVDNPQPSVAWSFTTGGGEREQKSWTARIYDEFGAVVLASGSGTGTGTIWTPSAPVLEIDKTYQAEVSVQDTAGLYKTSPRTTFTAQWTPPGAPVVTPSTALFTNDGYVAVNWTATLDPDFVFWRVYRQNPTRYPVELEDEYGQGDPTKLDYTLLLESSDPSIRSFNDWMAPSGYNVNYRVMQVVNRFGTLIESPNNTTQAIVPVTNSYWLIDPDNSTHNIKLSAVSDSFHEEYEMEVTHFIGYGRRVEYGDNMGVIGSLGCQVYDQRIDTTTTKVARQVRLELDQLKSRRKALVLKNPFGDVWLVATGDMTIDRMAGTGASEYFELSFDYTQVGE